MAEFQEIAAMARRMCESADRCEECYIGQTGNCVSAMLNSAEEAKKIEQMIVSWDKATPQQNVWQPYKDMHGDEWGYWYCPRCGKVSNAKTKFCPNCGQEMEV